MNKSKKTRTILIYFVVFLFYTTLSMGQQRKKENVGNLIQGLVHIDTDKIDVNNINQVDIINVVEILNNNEINVLSDAIKNNETASKNQQILNTKLRESGKISGKQVVVGVIRGNKYIVR